MGKQIPLGYSDQVVRPLHSLWLSDTAGVAYNFLGCIASSWTTHHQCGTFRTSLAEFLTSFGVLDVARALFEPCFFFFVSSVVPLKSAYTVISSKLCVKKCLLIASELTFGYLMLLSVCPPVVSPWKAFGILNKCFVAHMQGLAVSYFCICGQYRHCWVRNTNEQLILSCWVIAWTLGWRQC